MRKFEFFLKKNNNKLLKFKYSGFRHSFSMNSQYIRIWYLNFYSNWKHWMIQYKYESLTSLRRSAKTSNKSEKC